MPDEGDNIMDLSTLLGVVGIAVSVVLGLGTYYLTERRGKKSRWHAAKESVLRDLSNSLGEDEVPGRTVILATIRSVLRAQNAADLEAVTLHEIVDDLLRQITSDPFLDAKRRAQLQAKVLALRQPTQDEISGESLETAEIGRGEAASYFGGSSWGALLAGVVASLVAGLIAAGLPTLFSRVADLLPHLLPQLGIPLISVAVTVFVALIATIVAALLKRLW